MNAGIREHAINGFYTTAKSIEVIDATFGPRIVGREEFGERLFGGDGLEPPVLDELFAQSGGRIRLAQSVVTSADSGGIDLNVLEPTTLEMLLPAAFQADPSESDADPLFLCLLQALSWLPKIDEPGIALARSAVELLQTAHFSTPLGAQELLPELIVTGLLHIDAVGTVDFTIPDLVRAAARRLDTGARPAEGRTMKVMLGRALEMTYRTTASSDDARLDRILAICAEIEDWDLLESIWSGQGVNVFLGNISAATTSYLHVPDSVTASKPILAEARSAARQVSSVSSRLGSTDATAILPHVSFEMLDAPLEQVAADLESGPYTANEIIVVTVYIARAQRFEGDTQSALNTLVAGWRLVGTRTATTGAASNYYRMELYREHALVSALRGRYQEALSLGLQAIRIGETALPESPYPLLAAYSSYARFQMLSGRGSRAERTLSKLETLKLSCGFIPALPEYLTATARLFRSLDQLDLASASRELDRAKAACPHSQNDVVLGMGEGLHAAYTGHASFYTKTLDEQLGTASAQSNTPLDAMRLNLLSFVYLAAGETKPIQRILSTVRASSPGAVLAKARLNYVLGQIEDMDALIPLALVDSAGPRLKGSAHALRGAGLYSRQKYSQAKSEFDSALDYCAITSTLLPVAQLPRAMRSAFVTQTAGSERWNQLADSFVSAPVSAEVLRQRLLALPESITAATAREQLLDPAEISLLFMIESSRSIVSIAHELGLVEGTVKNRLSAMYKKMGVRNRRAAVDYGHSHGYF